MNSTIDRKRIFIFVGITYGIAIAAALVIFFIPGALTPVAMVISKKSIAVEKAAGQAIPGTVS